MEFYFGIANELFFFEEQYYWSKESISLPAASVRPPYVQSDLEIVSKRAASKH